MSSFVATCVRATFMSLMLFSLSSCGGGIGGTATSASGGTTTMLTSVRHVFIIVLENKGYAETFGPASPAPYLAKTLPSMGQLLTQYYGLGHNSLGNYISMISGQPLNLITQTDCQIFQEFLPGVADPTQTNGVLIGQGCIYPTAAKTVVDQLEAAHFTWKGYMEDLDDGTTHTCRHPAVNGLDGTQSAKATNQYAARHNPFVYFHGIIDDQARCDAHVVDLAKLDTDLASLATTPNYVFITPDLCSDGHDTPCVDGRPGGLVSINDFLKVVVPKILNSDAYKQDGMLLVTFDEADSAGAEANTACCGEPTGPNTPAPGAQSGGPGGGRTGAVILSPFTQPGSINNTPYNHYSMLRSVEDIFGLTHLGYAAQNGLAPFGSDVFNAP